MELEMPTRHRHEGVGDVSLIVRDAKPRRAAFRIQRRHSLQTQTVQAAFDAAFRGSEACAAS